MIQNAGNAFPLSVTQPNFYRICSSIRRCAAD